MTLTLAERGFSVLGFDVDPSKIEALERRAQLHPAPRSGNGLQRPSPPDLRATSDFARLREPDALMICVPTPADAPARAGHELRRRDGHADRGSAAAGAARRPGVHDIPGHDGRARPRDSGGVGPQVRRATSSSRSRPNGRTPATSSYGTADDPQGRRRRRPDASGDLAQALYDRVIAGPCASPPRGPRRRPSSWKTSSGPSTSRSSTS